MAVRSIARDLHRAEAAAHVQAEGQDDQAAAAAAAADASQAEEELPASESRSHPQAEDRTHLAAVATSRGPIPRDLGKASSSRRGHSSVDARTVSSPR